MPKETFTAPWFPWYVKDVLTSERVEMMTLAEEGAYRRALDKAWVEGSLPSDPSKCAKAIGKGCTVKVAQVVLEMFQPMSGRPDRVVNKRLEKIRKEQEGKFQKKSKAGKENVAKRWKKKTSGDSNGIPMIYQRNSIKNRTEQTLPTEEFKEIVSVTHACEIFVGTVTAELQKRMDLKTLPSKIEWQQQAEWAHVNGFTADQFLECYDLLKRQHWRSGPVKPKHVSENLPNLQKLRTEIAKQSNGKNQQHTSPGRRQSAIERIADHASILSQYPTEAELRDRQRATGSDA